MKEVIELVRQGQANKALYGGLAASLASSILAIANWLASSGGVPIPGELQTAITFILTLIIGAVVVYQVPNAKPPEPEPFIVEDE